MAAALSMLGDSSCGYQVIDVEFSSLRRISSFHIVLAAMEGNRAGHRA
jgi:hypothetical protein